MEVKKLDFGETLKDSVAIGVKNAPSVIRQWPYGSLRSGYLISMRGPQSPSPYRSNSWPRVRHQSLGIFDSKYRRYMGEFFITMG